MTRLHDTWAEFNRRFETELKELYSQPGEPQAHLFEAMSYSLNAGGKRLRPFLVNLFCLACGGEGASARSAGMAIEMIHTYSLIHDDLPAMDNDDYRRGKPTNHKVFGEALAILAGDGLLTDAFRVLSLAPLPADAALDCVRILSRCAGPFGMVGGQVLDIEAEQRACTEQEVLDIQSRKTGALIRAACEMGVVCGGGSPAQREAAGRYADCIGLAFQIQDDILDVTGDAAKLGKPVGTDEKKNTFVKLYGIETCRELVRRYTEEAVGALTAFRSPELLTDLAVFLAGRDR